MDQLLEQVSSGGTPSFEALDQIANHIDELDDTRKHQLERLYQVAYNERTSF